MKTSIPSPIKNVNRSRLLDNLSRLISQKGMTYAELESAADVYVGYISRMKADPRKLPALDVLYRMSQVLDVSIEWLIEGTFGDPDENILYVRRFIQRLFDLSSQHAMNWRIAPLALLSSVCSPAEQGNSHDRLNPNEAGDNVSGVLPRSNVNSSTLNFVSQGPDGTFRPVSLAFPGINCSFTDSAFIAPLDQDRSVLMVSLLFSEKANGKDLSEIQENKWLELQMLEQKTGARSVVACSSCGGNDLLRADLDMLYQHLKAHETDLPLDSSLRGAIDSFMQHKNSNRHQAKDLPRHLL